MLRFDLNESRFVVVEHVNGKAHAYCYHNDLITGDVWLFNTLPGGPADSGDIGINPANNCRFEKLIAFPQESEFRVMNNPSNDKIGIYLKGILIAIIWDGAKPGKSAFAAQDSRWAHTMLNVPDVSMLLE